LHSAGASVKLGVMGPFRGDKAQPASPHVVKQRSGNPEYTEPSEQGFHFRNRCRQGGNDPNCDSGSEQCLEHPTGMVE
jgi:hypothetical protein